jgi:cell wall-associated NlpC family hydrolase
MILALTAVTYFALGSASAATLADCAGKVACDALNVREKPSTDSAVLTTLAHGDTVVILDAPSGEWYKVSAYGTLGYVKSMYIAEVEAAKNFTATGTLSADEVRMRSKPDTSGDILGTYQTGTDLNVIGINNGWYKVQYDGQTGYIRSDLMEITGSQEALAVTSAGKEIAALAYTFVGHPYVYGAASPAVGFDCSGLAYYVYREFGYSISRTASNQFRNNGVSVSKDTLQPGDLVFFSSNGGKSITHVGVYYGDGMFVNASTSNTGVIFSSLGSAYYSRVYYGAKRIVS